MTTSRDVAPANEGLVLQLHLGEVIVASPVVGGGPDIGVVASGWAGPGRGRGRVCGLDDTGARAADQPPASRLAAAPARTRLCCASPVLLPARPGVMHVSAIAAASSRSRSAWSEVSWRA